MPAEQGLRFHDDQGGSPVGHDRGEGQHKQAVPDSKAPLSDEPGGDEELPAKERTLRDELRLGPHEICEEATTRAAGLARCRCERRPDRPPRDTAKAAEELTHMLTERQEHGPIEALNATPMEACGCGRSGRGLGDREPHLSSETARMSRSATTGTLAASDRPTRRDRRHVSHRVHATRRRARATHARGRARRGARAGRAGPRARALADRRRAGQTRARG